MSNFDDKLKQALQNAYEEWVLKEGQSNSSFNIAVFRSADNVRHIVMKIGTDFIDAKPENERVMLPLFLPMSLQGIALDIRFMLSCELNTRAEFCKNILDCFEKHINMGVTNDD